MTAGGAWTYTLDDSNATVQALNVNDTLSDTFTVHTIDGTAQVVTITIDGANDAAVISGIDTGDVTEAGGLNNNIPGIATATGALTDTDVDDPANSFIGAEGSSNHNYGSYAVDGSGNWSYTLDDLNPTVQALNNNDTLIDTFTVQSIDGTAHDVTITIHGVTDLNVAPALDLDANNSTGTGDNYVATFTDTGSPVAVADTDTSISDSDSPNMASATVTLTNAKAGDVLAVNGTLPGGIGATIDTTTPGTITVTLLGAASQADYAAALNQIVFGSQVNPDTTDRIITVVVNDGISDSNTAISTIHVIDATAPTAPSIASVTDDVAPVTGTLTSGGATNDIDLTVKVSLTGTGAVAGDTIQLYNGTGTGSQLGASYTLLSGDISNGFANVQTGTLSDGTTYASLPG